MPFTLEELEVYRLSETLGNDVWILVGKWQPFEKFGFGRQLTSAADSIAANIAEGYGRFFIKENIQFCFYARGSLMETRSWIVRAKARALIDPDVGDRLLVCLETIHKKLNAYIRVLRTNQKRQ